MFKRQVKLTLNTNDVMALLTIAAAPNHVFEDDTLRAMVDLARSVIVVDHNNFATFNVDKIVIVR